MQEAKLKNESLAEKCAGLEALVAELKDSKTELKRSKAMQERNVTEAGLARQLEEQEKAGAEESRKSELKFKLNMTGP